MDIVRDSYENPYYLSPSDHSSLTLVSDRLSGSADFNSWEQSMRMALNGRNKICFIDGSLPRPAANSLDFSTWSQCNDVVRSWIINSVSKTIGHSILFVKTAHETWKNLSEYSI